MGYDFEIHYKAWLENMVVDALSRLPLAARLQARPVLQVLDLE